MAYGDFEELKMKRLHPIFNGIFIGSVVLSSIFIVLGWFFGIWGFVVAFAISGLFNIIWNILSYRANFGAGLWSIDSEMLAGLAGFGVSLGEIVVCSGIFGLALLLPEGAVFQSILLTIVSFLSLINAVAVTISNEIIEMRS